MDEFVGGGRGGGGNDILFCLFNSIQIYTTQNVGMTTAVIQPVLI